MGHENNSAIDLFNRREERFFVPTEFTKTFLKEINYLLKVKRFSNYDTVETIYFNNIYHEIPWGISLKARRYKKNLTSKKKIKLNLKEKYLLEIKKESDQGSFSSEKNRYELSLKDAIAFVNKNDLIAPDYKINPYVITEYKRTHYILDSNIPFRTTIDNSIFYWYIPPNSNFGEFLGKELNLRVEIKMDYSLLNSRIHDLMKKLLNDCNAKYTVSKKNTAYNLLCRHRTKLGQKFPKELKDCEIETKLLIQANDASQVFRSLQKTYSQGQGNFRIEKIFPYIFESASINEYFYTKQQNIKKEALKFLFKGAWVKSLYKENLLIVDNSFNFTCITKRQEIKFFPYFIYNSNQYQKLCRLREKMLKEKIYPLGSLIRLRKTFWIESLTNGRLYHLSVDQCTNENERFCQLEIEYASSPHANKEHNPEHFIIEDIACITNQIFSNMEQFLKPTSLTKFQWIESLTK